MAKTSYKTVTIPSRESHEGLYSRIVTLKWVCPVCGEPRGEPFESLSYDGSLRLNVHCWDNPCGHIDNYADVRREADAMIATNAALPGIGSYHLIGNGPVEPSSTEIADDDALPFDGPVQDDSYASAEASKAMFNTPDPQSFEYLLNVFGNTCYELGKAKDWLLPASPARKECLDYVTAKDAEIAALKAQLETMKQASLTADDAKFFAGVKAWGYIVVYATEVQRIEAANRLEAIGFVQVDRSEGTYWTVTLNAPKEA